MPQLFRKDYDSFLEKTFRKNILENDQFPEEPKGGWITPYNWFSKVHDILRTQIIVKYLDGVDYIIKEFDGVCENNHIEHEVSYEARDEGYYAVHLNAKYNFNILGYNFESLSCPITVEIQIRTQLQEVIKNLLHTYYETKRIQPIEERMESKKDWKWDYKCEEFAANYLGHILHYVEGMIMDIRDKQMKKNREEQK
jgi:ppGpp synthetase/RelA/SpoT-type nucleotidyltranferase